MKSLSFSAYKTEKRRGCVSKTLGQQAKLPAKPRGSFNKMQREVGSSGHMESTGAGTETSPALSQGDKQEGSQDTRTEPSRELSAEAMRKGEPEKPTSLKQPKKTSRIADRSLHPSRWLEGSCVPTTSIACRMTVWVMMAFTALELGGLYKTPLILTISPSPFYR